MSATPSDGSGQGQAPLRRGVHWGGSLQPGRGRRLCQRSRNTEGLFPPVPGVPALETPDCCPDSRVVARSRAAGRQTLTGSAHSSPVVCGSWRRRAGGSPGGLRSMRRGGQAFRTAWPVMGTAPMPRFSRTLQPVDTDQARRRCPPAPRLRYGGETGRPPGCRCSGAL